MTDEFLRTVPEELLEKLNTYSQYSKLQSSDIDSIETELRTLKSQRDKLLQEKSIVEEQESSLCISFDKEEKSLKWNEEGLEKAKADTKAILYFEQQLEAAKRAYQKNVDFWESRVSTTKQELENKKNKKSKPLIKLNIKLEDLESKIKKKDEITQGWRDWQVMKEELLILKKRYVANKKGILEVLQKAEEHPEETVVVEVEKKVETQYPAVIQNTKEKKKPRVVQSSS